MSPPGRVPSGFVPGEVCTGRIRVVPHAGTGGTYIQIRGLQRGAWLSITSDRSAATSVQFVYAAGQTFISPVGLRPPLVYVLIESVVRLGTQADTLFSRDWFARR